MPNKFFEQFNLFHNKVLYKIYVECILTGAYLMYIYFLAFLVYHIVNLTLQLHFGGGVGERSLLNSGLQVQGYICFSYVLTG